MCRITRRNLLARILSVQQELLAKLLRIIREKNGIDIRQLYVDILSTKSIDNLKRTHIDPNDKNKEFNWINNQAIKSTIDFEVNNFQILIQDLIIFTYFVLHNFSLVLSHILNGHIRYSFIVCFLQYLLLYLVFQRIHRVIGYVTGFVIRAIMNGTTEYTGSWDIHIAWINTNINREELRIEFRNVVWRNHPEFYRSPVSIYLLLCIVNVILCITSSFIFAWIVFPPYS